MPTSKDMIKATVAMTDRMVQSYLGDLDDADLLLRPVDGMNHIAWQLGHLIGSERWFVEQIKPGASPALPEGFEAAHKKETAGVNDASKFHTKAEYLSLWKKQRDASLAVLDGFSEADLAKPSPEIVRKFCPTVAETMNMIGLHPMMHLGQWVAVRRKLKKPITM
jgi:hypothetical protein